MTKVAKLVIIDGDGKYLLMYRSDHPIFGRDPDLPGGMIEADESAKQAVIREVREETGVAVGDMQEVYGGLDYSKHDTHKSLFVTKVATRPKITISWEHSSYEWLEKSDFLQKAKNAKDDYMHMVYDVISKTDL